MQKTKLQPLPVHIRWITRRDMPEVIHIEQESYEYAWAENDFLCCLRQRNVIGMVAEDGDSIRGFMFYQLHESKLHLLNMAVDPYYRRRSIGKQFIAYLRSKLAWHRHSRATFEVRETNTSAQLFFRAVGFTCIRVLRGFYEDTGEDAYYFQFRIKEELICSSSKNEHGGNES